jgi:neutral ceramidase
MKLTDSNGVRRLSRRRFIERLGLTAAVGGVTAGLGLPRLSRASEGLPRASGGDGFLAGVAVRNITPTREIIARDSGRAMTVRFDEQGSPMKAKALALSFRRKPRMLVALDLPGIKNRATQVLREAIAVATGLAIDDIVISCSHTHSTPFIEEPFDKDKPHPFLDLVTRQATAAAVEAMRAMRPARIGRGVTYAVGASFNTSVPLSDTRVKFTRDFREGLAAGRPIDPRLSMVRIDDDRGRPIAGWVHFASHPANVIFNAPISAEYPGYMTDRLSKLIDGAPPFLFGFGFAGDVNCIPMFGRECESRNLGFQLADLAAETFASIQTHSPQRFVARTAAIELPLDEPPSIQTLDREIKEVEDFMAALDKDPKLVWLLGFNFGDKWTIEKKRISAKPFANWARRAKEFLAAGNRFPRTWTRRVTAWTIDDLGLLFCPGETYTEIGMAISARSPLAETLSLSRCNGRDTYLVTDAERRRGGYQAALTVRYDNREILDEENRPLPYALGAADRYIDQVLRLFDNP